MQDALTDIQALLIRHEGKRLTPYDDATGQALTPGDTLHGCLTVGVGRNLSEVSLTEEEVLLMLNTDIARAIHTARALCPVYDELIRPRQLVLLSMAFNLGRNRLAKFVRFLAAVEIGDYDDAADEMGRSLWAKQVGERAVELAWMMRHGLPLTV
jgi:lysozyme